MVDLLAHIVGLHEVELSKIQEYFVSLASFNLALVALARQKCL